MKTILSAVMSIIGVILIASAAFFDTVSIRASYWSSVETLSPMAVTVALVGVLMISGSIMLTHIGKENHGSKKI
jgi:uncharacterized protein (DUF983 family)